MHRNFSQDSHIIQCLTLRYCLRSQQQGPGLDSNPQPYPRIGRPRLVHCMDGVLYNVQCTCTCITVNFIKWFTNLINLGYTLDRISFRFPLRGGQTQKCQVTFMWGEDYSNT